MKLIKRMEDIRINRRREYVVWETMNVLKKIEHRESDRRMSIHIYGMRAPRAKGLDPMRRVNGEKIQEVRRK